MPPPPSFLQRYMVPEERPAAPAGFSLVDQKILAGLPHTISLTPDTTVLVLVPTGQAKLWRDSDPTALVSAASPELAPRSAVPASPPADLTRTPAHLLVRRGTVTEASIPLTIGATRRAPDRGGEPGVRLEIVVLDWEIRAGSLRGPGDFGSRVSFAWRQADAGVNSFGPLPVNPHVLVRILKRPVVSNATPERMRQIRPMESLVGAIRATELKAFQIKKAGLRRDIR